MKYVDLRLEAADAAQLAPFGALLAKPVTGAGAPSNFYAGHVQMSQPVKFRCDHPVEVSLASLRRRDGQVRYLERHFAHTQTFIPLGRAFVMVMVPPGDSDVPDVAAARAFHFGGHQGFALHVGTWHEFPFAIVDDTDIVVLMSSQTGYDLATKHPQTQEAFGPDLDKKDIAARTGLILTVNLDSQPAGPRSVS